MRCFHTSRTCSANERGYNKRHVKAAAVPVREMAAAIYSPVSLIVGYFLVLEHQLYVRLARLEHNLVALIV